MAEHIQITRMRRLPTVFSVFTTFSGEILDVKRFAQVNWLKSLTLEGKCLRWRAKPAHAEHPITRALIESQAKRQKRPKTVDAYARNLEDLMKAFSVSGVMDLVEAGPDDIENYVACLFQRHPVRVRNKHTSLPTDGLSPHTIQQRIVTARLFYDFCIYRG